MRREDEYAAGLQHARRLCETTRAAFVGADHINAIEREHDCIEFATGKLGHISCVAEAELEIRKAPTTGLDHRFGIVCADVALSELREVGSGPSAADAHVEDRHASLQVALEQVLFARLQVPLALIIRNHFRALVLLAVAIDAHCLVPDPQES